MKSFRLLVWLTQLGISVAAPAIGFIWLAVWLRQRFGLGTWVVIVGAVVGIFCAIDGLRYSMKAMMTMVKDKKEDKPPVAFNDHD